MSCRSGQVSACRTHIFQYTLWHLRTNRLFSRNTQVREALVASGITAVFHKELAIHFSWQENTG